jgi:hypothetical protein
MNNKKWTSVSCIICGNERMLNEDGVCSSCFLSDENKIISKIKKIRENDHYYPIRVTENLTFLLLNHNFLISIDDFLAHKIEDISASNLKELDFVYKFKGSSVLRRELK